MDKPSHGPKGLWIATAAIAGLIAIGVIVAAAKSTPMNPAPSTSSGNGQPGANTPVPNPSTSPPAQPTCVSADQAASVEGSQGCVQFTGYAYTARSGQMYLDQYTYAPYGFSVWIPAGTAAGPSLLSQYSGKLIDVTGYIQNYKGEQEIEVTSSSQITAAQ